jgi:hypothetical protein
VEKSAGDTLISAWPFAGTKCSAWPVSKECPRLSVFKAGYTKSATVSNPTLLSSSAYSLKKGGGGRAVSGTHPLHRIRQCRLCAVMKQWLGMNVISFEEFHLLLQIANSGL